MILSPDDHRSLQAIDGELATCEPHLAAMFRIFTRLNAEEAPPPSEDVIVAVPPPAAAPADPGPRRGWRGRRPRAARARPSSRARTTRGSGPGGRPGPGGRAGRPGSAGSVRGPGRAPRGRWRPVAAIAVPAALLVTVLIVMFATLTSTIKCRPAPATSGTAARSAAPLMPGNASLAACRQSARTGARG
jgi:hypothetical protein